MIGLSGGLIYLDLRDLDSLAAALTAALFLASLQARNVLFLGMETTPAFFLLCLLPALRSPVAREPRGRRFFVPDSAGFTVAITVLLVLVSLTRLECWAFAALWLATALVLEGREHGGNLGRIVPITSVLFAVGVAYVAVNLSLVGLPIPISGYLKMGPSQGGAWYARVFLLHLDGFVGLL